MNVQANRREQLRRQQEARARAQVTRRIVGIVAVLIAAALIGILVYAFVNRTPAQVPATASASSTATTPLAAQVVPAGANAEGNALVVAEGRAGTPTLTLYLDYQCPNCKSFEETFGPMLAQSAQAGDWTLQHKTMTFMDDNIGNTASTRAALGAACAADAGHYLDYSTQVYAHQAAAEVRGAEGYSDALLRAELPAAVGITGDALTAFQACYDGRATQDFVAGVNASAGADGVRGTPTLAINGTPVDFNAVTPFTPDGLKAYILAHA